jgi:hypothetical protein
MVSFVTRMCLLSLLASAGAIDAADTGRRTAGASFLVAFESSTATATLGKVS